RCADVARECRGRLISPSVWIDQGAAGRTDVDARREAENVDDDERVDHRGEHLDAALAPLTSNVVSALIEPHETKVRGLPSPRRQVSIGALSQNTGPPHASSAPRI